MKNKNIAYEEKFKLEAATEAIRKPVAIRGSTAWKRANSDGSWKVRRARARAAARKEKFKLEAATEAIRKPQQFEEERKRSFLEALLEDLGRGQLTLFRFSSDQVFRPDERVEYRLKVSNRVTSLPF